jgi:hypothetical protein
LTFEPLEGRAWRPWTTTSPWWASAPSPAGSGWDVPAGPYADWSRFGIADGLRTTRRRGTLAALVERLCERGELRALAVVLPPYLGDLGTDEDHARLVTALRMVHASRWLADGEQEALGSVIAELMAVSG